MTVPVYALIVGVSQYHSESFEALPAAGTDALHFAQSLNGWGIPESHIILMNHPLVPKETLFSHLKSLAELQDPFQIVFYFAGHGYRTSIPQSYLMFSDGPVELGTLIEGLALTKAVNLYFFIDACGLRLNAVMNPKLKEEMEGILDSQRTFFCLLSSGIFPSFEDEDRHYGYFTQALLKALCQIRKGSRSPTDLIDFISKELEAQNLAQPEMYNIGTCFIDFLAPLISTMLEDKLVRWPVIAELQDLLIKNRDQAVTLIGPPGSGKTILAQQLSSSLLKRYYNPSKEQLQDVGEGAVLIFDNAVEAPDHFELKSVTQIFLVQFSRSELLEFHLPALSLQEAELLVQAARSAELPAEFYYLISQGNPQKMYQALHRLEETIPQTTQIENVKRAIAAIYACGLFINEQLFSKIFGIESSTLRFLEKLGLLFPQEGCWYPHDFLIEMAESERLEIDSAATLAYWLCQFEELPHQFEVAFNVVLAIKCFSYESRLDSILGRAFLVLYKQGSKGLHGLKEGASIFSSLPQVSSSSLILADIFLEWGELSLAHMLLKKSCQSSKLGVQASVIQSHLFWRMGLFSKAIEKTSELIGFLPPSKEREWCYLHRGTAHFALGHWEEAKHDFSLICQSATHMKHMGLAKCLVGTTMGIRGIDIETSKDWIEAGIRQLIGQEDFVGAWMGWNNLGEIMWKAGDLRSSAYYLQKALEISKKVINNSALLETQRNLLQLELRSPYPNKPQIINLLQAIEGAQETMDFLVSMQVYNTLCTAYFYLKDNTRAHDFLKKALQVTAASNEYHIYTLANLSILFKIYNWNSKSQVYLRRAQALAQKGNNQLALKQITSDYAILGLPLHDNT